MAGQEQANVVPFGMIVPHKNSTVDHVSEIEENHDVSDCMKRDNVSLVYISSLKPRRGDDCISSMVVKGEPVGLVKANRQLHEATRGSIQTVVVEQPWMTKLDGMTDRQLKSEFRSEFQCYDAMKRRRYTHGAVIHDAFRLFRGFLTYMGPKPFPTATVDRRDPQDPEYSPWKVRWADKATQTENRRNTVWIKDGSKKVSAAVLGRKQHVSASAIRKRKLRGWSAAEILAGNRRNRAINFTKDEAQMKQTKNSKPSMAKQKIQSAKDVAAAFTPKALDNEPLSKVWVKALAASSGWFVPPLTIKDAGLLNRAVSQMPPGKAVQVIRHTINNWAEFTAAVEDYAGRVKTPSMPQVPFFVQFAMIASNLWLANQAPEPGLAYEDDDNSEINELVDEISNEEPDIVSEPAISAKELEDLEDDA